MNTSDRAGADRPSSGAAVGPVSINWWGGVCALAALPVLVFLVAVRFPVLWAWMGIGHLPAYFVDTAAVLAAGEANHAGMDVYAPNPFDPLGRPHVYGPWWLGTGALGLRARDATWIGAALGVAFLLGAAALLNPRDRGSLGWAAAALASPPVLMALERGNNDLVVFLMIAVAAVVLARPGWITAGLGGAMLLVATALKFYPVAALPVVAAGRSRRRALLMAAVVIAALELLAWSQWPAYHRALLLAPRPLTVSAYGTRIVAATWLTLYELRPWLVAGAAVALAVFARPLFRRPASLWRAVPRRGALAIAFIASALCWIACFFAGGSYPYRIVLLLLPFSLWLAQRFDRAHAAVARWQLVGWLTVSWLMVPKRWLAGDALEPLRGKFLPAFGLLLGFDQMLVILLTLALAIAVGGWWFRSIRDPA